MAISVIEIQSSGTDFSVNLDKLEDIPYLSRKSIDSNLNSPQCIHLKTKDLPNNEVKSSEEVLPLVVNLCDQTIAEEVTTKDIINIDINLVKNYFIHRHN